jgi:hypothetical protein
MLSVRAFPTTSHKASLSTKFFINAISSPHAVDQRYRIIHGTDNAYLTAPERVPFFLLRTQRLRPCEVSFYFDQIILAPDSAQQIRAAITDAIQRLH